MADVVIKITDVGGSSEEAGVVYTGVAFCTGMDGNDSGITFQTDLLEHGVLASTVNAAIKDAAIAAAAVAGYTVGALDKKTLLGGAVGL